MSTETRVEVKGNDRLMRFLNDMPNWIKTSGMQLMDEAASVASTEAKRLAPVRTGRLKKSIRKSHTQQGEYRVGSNVPYSGFVEYGTSKMAAQPFLRPAMEKANAHLNARAFELLKRQASGDFEIQF
jgi:HK97 gp10 family phage protein